MIIAVFSDVHGNLPALETFLNTVKNEADGYLCLGDTVNYGPWNDECLIRIQSLPNLSYIEGNHEAMFLNKARLAGEIDLVKAFYRSSIQRFSRVDLISGLKDEVNVGSFKAVHTICDKSIYPDTIVHLRENLFVGHSHHQFITKDSSFSLVNPGSVGQNRQYINIVEFALYDTNLEMIRFIKVRYDVGLIIDEMMRLGYPVQCINYYKNKLLSSLKYAEYRVYI